LLRTIIGDDPLGAAEEAKIGKFQQIKKWLNRKKSIYRA